MSRFPLSIFALLCAANLLLAGCMKGDSKTLELKPVGGTVVFDGKPAADVAVWFVPRTGTPGNGAYGVTEADGSYTLQLISGEGGVPSGKYGISFSRFVMSDGSRMIWGVQPESVGAVQSLPEHYVSAETSKVEATVTEAGGTFDFELSSKPPVKAPTQ